MYEARSRGRTLPPAPLARPPWPSLRGVHPYPLSAGSSRDFEGLPLQRAQRHGDLHRCASTQRVWHTPCRELIHASRPTVAEHCHRKTVTAVRRIRKRLPPPSTAPPRHPRLTPAFCASIADGRRVRVRRHPANRTSATLRRHRRMALSSPPTFDALQAASSRPRALRLRWLRPRAPRLKDGAPLGPLHCPSPPPSRPVHETGVIAWELLAVPCAERRQFLTGALPDKSAVVGGRVRRPLGACSMGRATVSQGRERPRESRNDADGATSWVL